MAGTAPNVRARDSGKGRQLNDFDRERSRARRYAPREVERPKAVRPAERAGRRL